VFSQGRRPTARNQMESAARQAVHDAVSKAVSDFSLKNFLIMYIGGNYLFHLLVNEK
jgi:hypothetical protein